MGTGPSKAIFYKKIKVTEQIPGDMIKNTKNKLQIGDVHDLQMNSKDIMHKVDKLVGKVEEDTKMLVQCHSKEQDVIQKIHEVVTKNSEVIQNIERSNIQNRRDIHTGFTKK